MRQLRGNRSSVSFTVPSVPFGRVLDQVAITARGDAHYADVLQAISDRMRLLQQMTRDLPDGYLRLQLQRRLSTDHGESLRWVHGQRFAIVPEARVQGIIASYPQRTREWFTSLHAEVRWLNLQERLCRTAKKEFSQLSSFLTAASSMSSASSSHVCVESTNLNGE